LSLFHKKSWFYISLGRGHRIYRTHKRSEELPGRRGEWRPQPRTDHRSSTADQERRANHRILSLRYLSLSLSLVGHCGFLLCFFSLSQRPVTARFCCDSFLLSFFWFLKMLTGCSTKCLNRIVTNTKKNYFRCLPWTIVTNNTQCILKNKSFWRPSSDHPFDI
jgi:hypothetical protein